MDQTYEEIEGFIRSKPAHVFAEILSGVIDCTFTVNPVLIIDTPENLKLWAKAIKSCFPEKTLSSRIFQELSFDKAGGRMLVIQHFVKEVEELYTNAYARTYNFVKNQFPDKGKEFKYASIAEYGALNSEPLMVFMKELLSEFDYACIDEDIDDFIELFLLVSSKKNDTDMESIMKALSFVNRYGKGDSIGNIYADFHTYLQDIMERTDKDQVKAIARFEARAFESIWKELYPEEDTSSGEENAEEGASSEEKLTEEENSESGEGNGSLDESNSSLEDSLSGGLKDGAYDDRPATGVPNVGSEVRKECISQSKSAEGMESSRNSLRLKNGELQDNTDNSEENLHPEEGAPEEILETEDGLFLESPGFMLCDCFDRLLFLDSGCTAMEVYDFFTSLMPSGKSRFYSFLISSGRLEDMDRTMMRSPDRNTAAFYMKMLAEGMQYLGYSWKEANSVLHFTILINSCGKLLCEENFGIDFLLTGLKDGIFVGCAAALLRSAFSEEASEQLTEAFVHNMDSLSPEEQDSVRLGLCSAGGSALVYEELLIRLKASEGRQETFEHWINAVFKSSQELSKDYYSSAIKEYLKHFKPKEEIYAQCEKLLTQSSQERYLDLESSTILVKGIENYIPLDAALSEKEDVIECVRRIKENFGIKTVPDILSFVDFGQWLEKSRGDGYSLSTILNGMPGVMFLRGARLRSYQDWCIPVLIPLVKTPEDHRRLVYAFRAGDRVHEFYGRYMTYISEFMEKDKLNGYDVFLQFAVYFFYYLKGEYDNFHDDEMFQRAVELMKREIYSQPSIFRKRLDVDLKSELSSRGMKVPAMWDNIINEKTEVTEESFMDRLKKCFSRRRRKE